MPRSAFLDTGVLLGFCFTVDSHHVNCRDYLDNNGIDYFISPTVEEEFENTKYKLNTRYSEAVLDHVSKLEDADVEGELDPVDLDNIKNGLLSRGNEAYSILYEFYDEVLPQFVQAQEVKYRLRELSRDIEQMALERKQELDQIVRLWRVSEDYPDVRDAISAIHEPDRTICIEGHDLASNMDVETDLATVNPRDYVRDGREELILSNTELSSVVNLA